MRLEFAPDDQLPPVRMDSDRISQVLINLITNAIRYCDNGWIEVSTERLGSEAIVKIQDSGPGIPAEKLENIFEAFIQLSTGHGRKSGGTGLGLAICKKIVELHGGRIWVESELGRGSAFYFALRLPEGDWKPSREREAEAGPGSGPRPAGSFSRPNGSFSRPNGSFSRPNEAAVTETVQADAAGPSAADLRCENSKTV